MLLSALSAALVVVAAIHVLTLRLSVRLVARTADNAWDNALGYLVVTGLLWYPLSWAYQGGWWWLLALPPLFACVLVAALSAIYQVSARRAAALGLVHAALASVVTTAVAVSAGAVAAYVIYGKIIADPRILLRLVLRLIGIEPPF